MRGGLSLPLAKARILWTKMKLKLTAKAFQRLSPQLLRTISKDIIYSKLALANAKGSLRGCYHADESFIGLKKLWSEDCFKVIGEVWRNGHAPYSLMKQAIAEDQELKEDKKLLPLLDSIYGERGCGAGGKAKPVYKRELCPSNKGLR